MIKRIHLLGILAALPLALAACEQDRGPGQQLGERMDEAAEDTADAMEKTGDDLRDSAEEASDAMEDAADEMDDGY